MSKRSKLRSQLLSLFLMIISLDSFAAVGSDSISLYTPYTRISVPPGESIDYAIDVINNSSKIINADISIAGIPKGWTYDLKSGGVENRTTFSTPSRKEDHFSYYRSSA